MLGLEVSVKSTQLLAPALLACGLLLSGGAHALTLADVVSGDSFVSGNGTLTFDNFEIKKLKRLSGNLSLYTIVILDNGFTLTSDEFTANTKGLRKLDFSYRVTSSGAAITEAGLAITGSRDTGKIKVEKDIDAANSDEGTFLFAFIRNGNSSLEDSDTFSPISWSFDVDEQIRIKKISQLSSVTNTFVAEPSTLSLLAAGLGGLAWIGRRRRA
jgi:hypothetical protein